MGNALGEFDVQSAGELALRWMVRLGGFEPPTFGATIQRSNQLSYNRVTVSGWLVKYGFRIPIASTVLWPERVQPMQ